jgi:DNA-binding beta-propeller fold protein YncE
MRLRFPCRPVLATSFLLVLGAGCNANTASPREAAPPSIARMPAAPVASAADLADAAPPAQAVPPGPRGLTGESLPLPGAPGRATLDYLLYEREHQRLWVPVGETGSVDVLDPASRQFTRIDGFGVADAEVHGKKRKLGPSSAAAGDGFVYVGDRASKEVCPVDSNTLKPRPCLKLAVPPDGVAYVASAKEVWVTTPRDSSLTVLDATTPGLLKPKVVIKTPGEPEGYAVDDGRALFFTNLEDADRTIVIDVPTHKVRSTWPSGCGAEGPRGIAIDAANSIVMVACPDRVRFLDAQHDGAELSTIATGQGVDNVDWLPARRLLYVGAAKSATLSVLHVDAQGHPVLVATAHTAEGVRNAVVDANGTAYLADPMSGGVFVVPFAP